VQGRGGGLPPAKASVAANRPGGGIPRGPVTPEGVDHVARLQLSPSESAPPVGPCSRVSARPGRTHQGPRSPAGTGPKARTRRRVRRGLRLGRAPV